MPASTGTVSRQEWTRVSRSNRCPICESDSWCTYTDSIVLCMRSASNRPKTLRSGEQGWLHQRDGAQPIRPVPGRQRPEPTINCGKLLETWSNADTAHATSRLSELLGVSLDSLMLLRCVWAPPHGAWAFPMRDGYGELTGIRLRSMEGKKWAVRGSHQGIFLPWSDSGHTAWVMEGPTDTAAALTLGLYAVGRPSCSGGMHDIQVAFKRLGVNRAVIVADNDDPGMRGAAMLAEQLTVPTATLLLPVKDMREFLNCGGTKSLLDSMLNNVVWKVKKNP